MSGKPQAEIEGAEMTQAADNSEETGLRPSRKIFVNRTLRFDQISMVGFDMDYTLLKYRKQSIEALSFRLTVEKLVQQFGYPTELQSIPYDPDFVVRGLVVDKKTGNIFKMDHHNHVGRVYHGRRLLTKDERRELYRNTKIRLSGPRYHWIDTMFALPEAALYADIIDLFELQLGRKKINYRQLFTDIRAAIDECHRDDSLKAVIKADLASFAEEDPDLAPCLHKLRSSGKKVFLLTNSYWAYTNAAMTHLLNNKLPEYPNWENYFDFIVVGASKPSFFTEDRKFLALDRESGEPLPDVEVQSLDKQYNFQGGCIADFKRFVNVPGEQVLYVGDHIYGDIIRSKKESLWRTALVLDEMEDEIEVARKMRDAQSELLDMEERRADLEHEITHLKLVLNKLSSASDNGNSHSDPTLATQKRELKLKLDKSRRQLKTLVAKRDELEIRFDRAFNPYWGSVFKEGQDNSCFGRQVERYACIYTSRASNFRFYSPVQYFRSPRHWMAHEKL